MSVNLTLESQGVERLGERLRQRVAKAQDLLTVECKLAADEFTPVKSGSLRDNFAFIQELSCELPARTGWVYHEPYARLVWEGVSGSGNPVREPPRPGSTARSRWTEHAAAAHKDAILEKVKKELEK